MDAWRQLNDAMGVDEENPAIPQRTFYRYAEKFLDLYQQVEAEHRRRITRLQVSDATDGETRDMTRLGRNRFVELVTEALVTSDHISELGGDVSKLAAVLADAERSQHNADKLELDKQNLEHRAAKAEAEIEKMRQDAEHKRVRFDERLTKLQSQIDELLKRASRGEQITEEHLRHADADLEALRKEAA